MKMPFLNKVCRSCYFVPGILLVVGLLLASVRGVSPSPDSFGYLNSALKFYNNPCLSNIIIWRPVFPLLIWASYHIFGISVDAGFYVVRMFFVLNIMLSYLFGARLFDKKTGLLFSLLILTSFPVNDSSTRLLLDIVLPFFMLSYILLLYIALEKRSNFQFLLAGLCLGICILTKGCIGMFYILLPLLMLSYSEYRKGKIVIGLLELYGITFLVILPWLWKIAFSNETLYLLIGPVAKFSQNKGIMFSGSDMSMSIWEAFGRQLISFCEGLKIYVADQFIIWPLFVLGTVCCVYLAVFKKSRTSGIIIFSIMSYMPILFFGGKMSLRAGQFVTLYFLLYSVSVVFLLKAGIVLHTILSKVGLNETVAEKAGNIVFIVLLLLSLGGQIFVKHLRIKPFKVLLTDETKMSGFTFWPQKLKVTGVLGEEAIRSAAKWFAGNTNVDERIMCDNIYHGPLTFFTGQQYSVKKVQYRKMRQGDSGKVDKAIFIWPKINNQRKLKNNYLVGMFERELLGQFENFRPKYFMIGPRRSYLALYFNKSKSFELLETIDKGRVKIYKVKYPLISIEEWDTRFEDITFRYLNSLHKQLPKRYTKQKQRLSGSLDWPASKIQKFYEIIENESFTEFNQRYELFKRNEIY